MIWANLLHLSFNMWEEAGAPIPDDGMRNSVRIRRARPDLRFDDGLWNDLLIRMREAGMNMVVLDLGDGVEYESHPEIAVQGAWTPKRLRHELVKMRAMGLEPIPKLNFSAAHDEWLGPYARRVSSEAYYAVCRELIAEVCQLFDHPRLFHLGMDEETAHDQRYMLCAVVRQHNLWWHDLHFYVREVERAGARAWVWADCVWRHPKTFFRKMPRSVLQSNWYYGPVFNRKVGFVQGYLDLDAHGYDQVPTGSPRNFERTVTYCRNQLSSDRLLGFLQTPWFPTLKRFRRVHFDAIDAVGSARLRPT